VGRLNNLVCDSDEEIIIFPDEEMLKAIKFGINHDKSTISGFSPLLPALTLGQSYIPLMKLIRDLQAQKKWMLQCLHATAFWLLVFASYKVVPTR
jgi:hypothetical protein